MQRHCSLLIAALLATAAACGPTVIESHEVVPEHFALRLHPSNPHYFEHEGKPTVLVSSGEHYGALMNLDFDYVKYFDELHSKGLNHTRVFSATYREVAGNFGIVSNTLAPAPDRFIAPWPRSDRPGARDGLAKFDLTKWNQNYFDRLKNLLAEAESRGIIVELVLFCPYYNDSMWEVSPLNIANNINGVGDVSREQALTMTSAGLVEAQQAVAQKTVLELRNVRNVYFEICNEPYALNLVANDWQRNMAAIVAEADALSAARHIISMNYANGSAVIANHDPLVSLYNFHYSRPPESVGMNYALDLAIGNNETGFDGSADSTYRIQGWDFLFAGGALYNNLDYSFSVGHEPGDLDFQGKSPGGGSAALRSQLGHLRRFFEGLPFIEMAPDATTITSAPKDASARVLSTPDKTYAVYLHRGRIDPNAKPRYVVDSESRTSSLVLDLPTGRYSLTWTDPRTGAAVGESQLNHQGGAAQISTPAYSEDFALVIAAL
ncbi:MAG: hypothetical protein O2795_09490 [Acidobacteria bacterium]|nr:hypothetical protein [Acidobacteriota bacterium]